MIALVLCALVALAQDNEPTHIEQTFERFDTDDSGALDEDELSILSRARFEDLDKDDDGSLSLEEFRDVGVGRDVTTTFRRLDVDEDGRIAESEIPESLRARFEGADVDRDGFIDPNEVKMMAVRERQARNAPSGLMRRLLELDIDGDSRLHLDELPDAMHYLREGFDTFDINGDGYLDGRELRVMTEAPRYRRR